MPAGLKQNQDILCSRYFWILQERYFACGERRDTGIRAEFLNIGSKMSYTDSREPDFIPMNMRLEHPEPLNLILIIPSLSA